MRLFRVVVPVPDVQAAVAFYEQVLNVEADHSAPGRPYFHCEGAILAVVDPGAHGGEFSPNPDLVYFAAADLEATQQRAREAGGLEFDSATLNEAGNAIAVRPWGERSFYCRDPFGNPLCFVDDTTLFLGSPGQLLGDARGFR